MQAERGEEVVVHGGAYDHVDGLAGVYREVRLVYRALPLRQIFAAMLEQRAYPACEFSLANYLILRGRGERWLSALPIFPYRAFRHSPIVTRKQSPIDDFRALAGKRVGIDDYSMTAAVWLRGLLLDEYGVDHRSITWVTAHKQRLPIPDGARVERTAADLESLLLEGGIDAMLGMSLRDAQQPAAARRLRSVLPDPQAAERDYFARTSIYPINHCVVVRDDALARLPSLPGVLSDAYSQAKARAYARRSASVLPWGTAQFDLDMARFGGDPLPYDLGAVNRKVVTTLARYLAEQGYLARVPALEEVFAG